MPTQMLTFAEVAERYGVLESDSSRVPSDHPIAAGLPAGHVTDDTDQAVILGRLLVAGGGRLDPYAFVAELQAWERADGRRSVRAICSDRRRRRALERIAAGEDVATTGRDGTTNGAAMRIAPVGVVAASRSHLIILSMSSPR